MYVAISASYGSISYLPLFPLFRTSHTLITLLHLGIEYNAELRPALPVVILNSPAVSDPRRGGSNPSFGTGRDIAGIILFAIGLYWEAAGDIQKVRTSVVSSVDADSAGYSTCSNRRNRPKGSLARGAYGISPGEHVFLSL